MASENVDLRFGTTGVESVIQSLRSLNAGLGGVQKGLDLLSGPFTKIAALATAASFSLQHVVTSSAAFVRQSKEMAEITGLTVGRAAGLAGAMDDLGIEVGTLQQALFRMSAEIDSGGQGLQRLGISIRDSDGALKSSGNLFLEVRDRIAEMGSETERATVMRELFGRGSAQLITLFGLERAELDAVIAGNEELFDVTERDVTAFRKMGIATSDVRDVIQKFFLDISRDLIPAIVEASKLLVAMAPILNIVTIAVRALAQTVQFLALGWKSFADVVNASLHTVFLAATGQFGKISEEWEKLSNRLFEGHNAYIRQSLDSWGLLADEQVKIDKDRNFALTQGELALAADIAKIEGQSASAHADAQLEILELDRRRMAASLSDKEAALRFELETLRIVSAEKVEISKRALSDELRQLEATREKERLTDEKYAAMRTAIEQKHADDVAVIHASQRTEEARISQEIEDAIRAREEAEIEAVQRMRDLRLEMQAQMQADIDRQLEMQARAREQRRAALDAEHREIIASLQARQRAELSLAEQQARQTEAYAVRISASISSTLLHLAAGTKKVRDVILSFVRDFLAQVLQAVIRKAVNELGITAIIEAAKAKMAGFGASIPTLGASIAVAAGLIAAIVATQKAAMSEVKGFAALAQGGIVTRPTVALLGEAGPEAVIPLSRSNVFSPAINVTVTGNRIESDVDVDRIASRVGEEIMRRLRIYNRA